MILCRKLYQTRKEQIFYLTFNFLSTVAITFINKICFSKVQFGFPAALCNIHFLVTWLGVEIMRRLNMFEAPQRTPSLFDKEFLAVVFFVGTVT